MWRNHQHQKRNLQTTSSLFVNHSSKQTALNWLVVADFVFNQIHLSTMHLLWWIDTMRNMVEMCGIVISRVPDFWPSPIQVMSHFTNSIHRFYVYKFLMRFRTARVTLCYFYYDLELFGVGKFKWWICVLYVCRLLSLQICLSEDGELLWVIRRNKLGYESVFPKLTSILVVKFWNGSIL